MKSLICLLAIMVMPAADCVAQTVASIEIGSMRVQPGMSVDTVRNLAERYSMKLTKYPTPDAPPIEETYGVDGQGLQQRGSLTFVNGRLITAIRQWEEDQRVGVDFARWLYGAFASLIRSGHRSCLLSSQQNEAPGVEFRKLAIVCGSRTIEVSILRREGEEAALISEKLSAR